MNIFVAGASGVIGLPLLKLLRDAGHAVTGTTRSPSKAGTIESLGARAVVVDTEYSVLDAIQTDKVTLVTSGIARITPDGIEAADGTHHAADIIVYATGFKAHEYLYPMTIRGRTQTFRLCAFLMK